MREKFFSAMCEISSETATFDLSQLQHQSVQQNLDWNRRVFLYLTSQLHEETNTRELTGRP